MGITGQRATQICDALKRADLILVQLDPKDSRVNCLQITGLALDTLNHLNAQLLPMVTAGLLGREKIIPRIQRSLRVFMNIFNQRAT
jgi:DNA-binding MarR family transcriptional regulator